MKEKDCLTTNCSSCEIKREIYTKIQQLNPKVKSVLFDVIWNVNCIISMGKEIKNADERDGREIDITNFASVLESLKDIEKVRRFIRESSIEEINSFFAEIEDTGSTVWNKTLIKRYMRNLI